MDDILKMAEENNCQIKNLKTNIENVQLRIDKKNLDRIFSVSASSGNSGSSGSDINFTYTSNQENGNPDMVLSGSPAVSIGLGDPMETEIQIKTPFSINFQEGIPFIFTPQISIMQPLNDLLGLTENTTLEDMEDLYSFKKAEIDLYKKIKSVQIDTLTKIKNIYELEKSLKELAENIKDAEDEINKVKSLRIYSPESSTFLSLGFNLDKLKREKEFSLSKYKLKWKELETITGTEIKELPLIEQTAFLFPDINQPAKNPDIYLAALIKNIEEQKLNDILSPFTPEFSIGSSYKVEADNNQLSGHNLEGTIKGIFENFSLSTSIGGVIDKKETYLSLGFSWSLPDKRAENIDIKEYKNNLLIADVNLTSAETDFVYAVDTLNIQFKELENRTRNLQDSIILSGIELEEAVGLYSKGLISKRELEHAQWNNEKNNYEEIILRIDFLTAQRDLDMLFLPDKEL